MGTAGKKKRKRFWRVVRYTVLSGFFVFVAVTAWAAYVILQNLPDPKRLADRAVAQSTKIYDRTETILLYEIHGDERRTVVPLSDIPLHVRSATIAAEDINFYTHIGLDWRGILRALIKNLSAGDIRQGGSTITQQLVKNSILSAERTYTRKFKEALLALSIETTYSKDEILELYLNQIPYGSNAYGVSAASRIYFSKPVEALSVAEAAILASLLKAPTYYFTNKDELLVRKDWVIGQMANGGFISEEEAERAKKERVSFSLHPQSIIAPHFVLYVRELLNKEYGEDFVERGGLTVVTTLDADLQKAAEAAVRAGAERNEPLGIYNTGLVAIDPNTGEIVALVGSRDYWEDPKPKGCAPGITCKFDPHVNIALRKRQPGSAFKPFVYAAAFKKGYAPETVLFDAPTEFSSLCNPDGTPGPATTDPKACYHPQNYDKKFRGPVSLREALAQSLNVPSVKLLYLAGVRDSIETASQMGITTLTDPDRYGLSLVLGGAEVTLLEMTSAFGVFAKDGVLYPKTALRSVEDQKGKILYESRPRGTPVLDTEVARTITDILVDNKARTPIFGQASTLYFPDRAVAVKTGTTQDFRDAWVVGYTPSLVVGVWAGNNDNSSIERERLSAMVAAPIWREFLETTFEKSPPEDFTRPEKERPEKAVLRGVYRGGQIVRIDSVTGKRATEFTPPELVVERAYGSVSTILASIDRENPLGDPPKNPWSDPQYKNWQAGIDSWLSQNAFFPGAPPEDFDPLHTEQNQPKISFSSFPEDRVYRGTPDEFLIGVSHVFPLKEISFFIDDLLVQSFVSPDGSVFSFRVSGPLANGAHSVRVRVYDEIGNTRIDETTITVLPKE